MRRKVSKVIELFKPHELMPISIIKETPVFFAMGKKKFLYGPNEFDTSSGLLLRERGYGEGRECWRRSPLYPRCLFFEM